MVMSKKLLKIIVITVSCLILFLGSLYFTELKSGRYRFALEFIKNNKLILQNIGKIKRCRLAFWGYHVKFSGSRGESEYRILVKGEKDEGTVYLELEKLGKIWKVRKGTLVLNTGSAIPLLKGEAIGEKR